MGIFPCLKNITFACGSLNENRNLLFMNCWLNLVKRPNMWAEIEAVRYVSAIWSKKVKAIGNGKATQYHSNPTLPSLPPWEHQPRTAFLTGTLSVWCKTSCSRKRYLLLNEPTQKMLERTAIVSIIQESKSSSPVFVPLQMLNNQAWNEQPIAQVIGKTTRN